MSVLLSLEGEERARKLFSVNNWASKTMLNSELKRGKEIFI